MRRHAALSLPLSFLIVLVAGLVLGDPNREPGEADVPVVIAGGDDEAPAEASTESTPTIASDRVEDRRTKEVTEVPPPDAGSGGRGPVNVSAPPDDAIAAADGGRPVGEDESRMIVEAPIAPEPLEVEARPAVEAPVSMGDRPPAVPGGPAGAEALAVVEQAFAEAPESAPEPVVVRSRLGESISDVAFRVFGSRERTILLFDANPGISDGPYRPLPAGSALRLP